MVSTKDVVLFIRFEGTLLWSKRIFPTWAEARRSVKKLSLVEEYVIEDNVPSWRNYPIQTALLPPHSPDAATKTSSMARTPGTGYSNYSDPWVLFLRFSGPGQRWIKRVFQDESALKAELSKEKADPTLNAYAIERDLYNGTTLPLQRKVVHRGKAASVWIKEQSSSGQWQRVKDVEDRREFEPEDVSSLPFKPAEVVQPPPKVVEVEVKTEEGNTSSAKGLGPNDDDDDDCLYGIGAWRGWRF